MVELRRHYLQWRNWRSDSRNYLISSKRMCGYQTCKLGDVLPLHNNVFVSSYVFVWPWKTLLHKYGYDGGSYLRSHHFNVGLGHLLLITTDKLYRHGACTLLLVDGTDNVLLLRLCICSMCNLQKILLKSRLGWRGWRCRRWGVWIRTAK